MESVANFTTRHHHHHRHRPLTLHHRRPSISKPISSISFTTQFPSLKISSFSSPIRASLSNHQQNPSISPLKNTLIAAVAGAAVLLSQFNLKPVLATTAVSAPSPPATIESESVVDPEMGSVNVADPEEEQREESVVVTDTDFDSVAGPEAETNLTKHMIEALRNLIEVKVKDNKLNEALGLLDKLMILQPDNEEWPILKAYIHNQTGNYEESKKIFHGIISKHPFKIEAYHGLIMVASQKESEKDLIEAEEKIKNAMEKAKESEKISSEREFNVLLAQIMVIKGDYDNALSMYKDLIEEAPKDFRPYLCQGIIYTLLKKDVDAEASFEKYKSLVPEDHPYGEYFENNIRAAKLFAQKEGNAKPFSRR